MRILILGGSGAVGSAVARYCSDVDLDIHVTLRTTSSARRLETHPSICTHIVDLSTSDALASLVSRLQPTAVLMCAFGSHPRTETTAWRRRSLVDMSVNLLNVFDALELAGFTGRLIWLGSAMAYGQGQAPRDPRQPMRPTTFRGALKAAESLLASQRATQTGIALTELRLFTGYGPFEQPDRLIPALLRAALDGTRVALGPAETARDWVHYDDIARAVLAAAQLTATAPCTFNLCSGQLHRIGEVARMLESITGRELTTDTPFERSDQYGSVEPGIPPSAEDAFGWSPSIELDDGLRRCWDWAQTGTGQAFLKSNSQCQ